MEINSLLSKEERKLGKVVKFQKGNILFHEEEKCLHVGILLSGLIEIKSYTLSGQEILYNRIKKGDMFGNNLIMSSFPYYKGNVIAESDGEVFY